MFTKPLPNDEQIVYNTKNPGLFDFASCAGAGSSSAAVMLANEIRCVTCYQRREYRQSFLSNFNLFLIIYSSETTRKKSNEINLVQHSDGGSRHSHTAVFDVFIDVGSCCNSSNLYTIHTITYNAAIPYAMHAC